MKKLIICLLVFFSIMSDIFSQCEQGDIYLGATSNFNFSYTKTKHDNRNVYPDRETNGSGFDIAPMAGFFVTDGLVLGLFFNAGFNTEKDDDGNKQNESSIIAGPFLHYYFGSKKIKPYIGILYGLGSESTKIEDAKEKYFITSTIFEAGAAIFFNEHAGICIGPAIHYDTQKNKDTEFKVTTFSVGLRGGVVVIL